MALEWQPVAVVARQEFRDRIRNRWVLAVAVVLALFALAIAWAGMAQQGQVGFGGLEVTIASLASLAVYLVPLIALLLGYDAIVGERERGALDLLLALPITRVELLLGKFAGLGAALAAATTLGFGLALLPLAARIDANGLWHYAGFVASAVLMGLAFLSLALAVSALARDRARASGAAIALWFFFVLAFDLVLMGLLVARGDGIGGPQFGALLLLNPADVFRMLNIFASSDLQEMYGLATALPGQLTQPALLGGVLLAWTGAPLAIAAWRFR
ncbi:MAG: ABC transporter permease [Telluria sp.]